MRRFGNRVRFAAGRCWLRSVSTGCRSSLSIGLSSYWLFEQYQRSEKALVSALAEMYVQGVSTRQVKALTEGLCGHAFSASAVSGVVKRLDEQLSQFAQRRLEEAFAYVILDARYEKVRESGSIRSRAVLVAIGIDREGRRQVLGVELAKRESASSWKDFLLTLRQLGLKEVELVVRTMPDYAKRLPRSAA